MRTIEFVLVAFLLIGGLLTRLSYLNYPAQVIFDEVHFGKFVNAYCCTQEHFFDIHPPHGKLLIAAAVATTSYTGFFPFENIGDDYSEEFPVVAFRLMPALAGALIPLIFFVLLRQLGATIWTAFLGGSLILLDNALIVQSRLISLDSILVLATFGSLSAYLAGLKSLNMSSTKKKWFYISGLWFVTTGVLGGLAVGTKLTGLAALGIILSIGTIFFIRSLWVLNSKVTPAAIALSSFVIIGCACLVYFSGWAIHSLLLTKPGYGDAFYVREATIFKKHQVMLSANYGLAATHPYASRWYTWPLMQRPVFYWQDGDARLYFLGNPAIWWGATLFGIVGLIDLIRRYSRGDNLSHNRKEFNFHSAALLIPILGYVISFWPLIRVPRPLFLYHYVTPLLFSLLFCLLWLDHTRFFRRNHLKAILSLFLTVLVITIFFSPVTYGYAVPEWWQRAMIWLPTWR